MLPKLRNYLNLVDVIPGGWFMLPKLPNYLNIVDVIPGGGGSYLPHGRII